MPTPTGWIRSRLPTQQDADPFDMVRWGPDKPGLLMIWHQVRYGEPWTHSSAWRPPLEAFWVTEIVTRDRTADHLAYGLDAADARAVFVREHPEAEILLVRPVQRPAAAEQPVPEQDAA